jgi:hypothetical protein
MAKRSAGVISIQVNAGTTQFVRDMDTAKSKVRDFGRTVGEDIGKGTLAAGRGLRELAGTIHDVSNATKDIVIWTAAAGTAVAAHGAYVDTTVNSYRALRLAMSPTPFTAVTIASVMAAEAIAKLILQQDRLIEQDAKLAALKGVSPEVTTGFRMSAASVPGVDTSTLVDAFKKLDTANLDQIGMSTVDASGRVKEAGEILGEALRRLGEIKDPGERVRKTFAVFGEEIGDKLLPHLNARLEENARFTREWAIAMPEATKQAVDETSRDLRALGSTFDSTFDDVHSALNRGKIRIIADFADLYIFIKKGLADIESAGKGNRAPSFGGQLESVAVPKTIGPEDAVEKARELIAKLGVSGSDAALKEMGVDSKALSSQVDTIVADRAKALDALEAQLSSEKARLTKLISNRDVSGGQGLRGSLLDQQISQSNARVCGASKAGRRREN